MALACLFGARQSPLDGEPLAAAQDAYVKHVNLTGDTRFTLSSLAPVIQGVQEQFGVGPILSEGSLTEFGEPF